MKEYLAAEDKLQEVTDNLTKLYEEIRTIKAELEQVVLTGESTDHIWARQDKLEQQIEEELIREKAYQQEVDRLFPNFATKQIEKLQAERTKILAEGSKQSRKYEKLRKDYYDFKAIYESDSADRGRKADRLGDEIRDLENLLELHELQELEKEEADHDR